MSFREKRAETMVEHAARALTEGRTIFVAQFRGSVTHSPELSRPIGGAEMIESVEAQGWQVDQFTSAPYRDNMTVVCMFRRRQQQLCARIPAPRWPRSCAVP